MTTLKPVVAAACLGFLTISGCGDNKCREVFVAITSPTTSVSTDSNVTEDGVQTDITVSSNLREGDELSLQVLDSAGAEVATAQVTATPNGDATFSDVTVPNGTVTLRVTGSSGCDSYTDEVEVEVGGANCVLTVREDPTDNDFYDMPVVNTTHDLDPNAAGFQGNIDVQTLADYQVEVFVLNGGSEISAGTVAADDTGAASLAVTLSQGQTSLRAVCRGASNESSLSTVIYVDTVAPTCALQPAAGTTIIPALDLDSEPANGTQIELVGSASDSDVEGEDVSFTFDSTPVTAAALDANGESSVTVSFDDANQADWATTFATQDHAGNPCQIDRTYAYQTEGCLITITDPSGVITTDANGNSADGLQYDLEVTVDAACAGQTVTTTCDATGPASGVVPGGGGAVTIPVTLCEDADCEETIDCTASVTDTNNITTTDGVQIVVDTRPPDIALDLLQPNSLACGQQIDPAADINGNPGDGVQIRVRANDLGLAAMRWIAHTPPGGTEQMVAVGGNLQVDLTLPVGLNLLAAVAVDAAGNMRRNPIPDCRITLSDIAVDFAPDIADGIVGTNDGSVSGSDLTLDVCGTVSRPNITVEVSIDSGTAMAATVTGNDWCLNNVVLSEGNHRVDVTATDGGLTGSNTLDPLVVDLTPPDAPTNPLASMINRQEARFQWTAPQDGSPANPAASYTVKISDVMLTSGNFDSTGVELVAPTPSTPGMTDGSNEIMLRPGAPYYFGVVAYDGAGNRSALAATASPLVLDFSTTGAVSPTLTSMGFGWHQLGAAVAGGDFNGDGFGDLAVGAPWTDFGGTSFGDGVVYVYLGGPTGLDTDPAYIIRAVENDGLFGGALTTMRWNSDNVDDLVVGASRQDALSGRVSVFFGGSRFSPGGAPTPITLQQGTAADINIESDGAGTFFTSGRLGTSLATARFNSSDARDDLVIGVAGADSSRGGAIVLFGGTTDFGTDDTLIVLSDTDTSEMGQLRASRIRFASQPTGSVFGTKVVNLGKTEGVSDATDDVAIVPYTIGAGTPKTFFVYRGRAAAPAVGLNNLAFSATVDLSVNDGVNPPSSTSTAFGLALGTVRDLDGDGARDIVVGDDRASATGGYVALLDGNAVGNQTVAAIQIARINGGSGVTSFGSAIVNNRQPQLSDVDGDGLDDLLVVGNAGGTDTLYVWYGDQLPTSGTVGATATFDHSFPEPAGVNFSISRLAAWIGDVNADGLNDICWADEDVLNGSEQFGAFQVLR